MGDLERRSFLQGLLGLGALAGASKVSSVAEKGDGLAGNLDGRKSCLKGSWTATNEVDLPAGTYQVSGGATDEGEDVFPGRAKARLRELTHGKTLLVGNTDYGVSGLQGTITFTEPTRISLEVYNEESKSGPVIEMYHVLSFHKVQA